MEMTAGSSAPQIKTATSDQAMVWIKGGWELFKQAPGIWIAILLVYMLLAFAAGMIPLIGSLAFSLFTPVFTLGWLQGSRDLKAGNPLKVSHLFAGFQSPRMGSLVMLGLLSLAIGLGFGLIAGLGAFGIFMGGGQVSAESIGLGALFLSLVVLLALLVLAAVFLFATPLVGFAGMSPVDAVKLSLSACLKNWLSMLVWGLIALLLTMLGAIPFGLGLLVVIPMLSASYYLMYCDIFGAP